jgi:hypothetical protein
MRKKNTLHFSAVSDALSAVVGQDFLKFIGREFRLSSVFLCGKAVGVR